MRLIRTAIATLSVVSMVSLAYAWIPGRDAARTSGAGQEASSTAQQDQSKPPKQTPPPKQTSPPKQTPKAGHPKAEEAKPPKAEKKQKEQSRQEHTQQTLPAGNSARIPGDQFKAHFGQPHRFAAKQIITTTRIVPNQTRFIYFGYTFIFVDPWPTDWLLTDDCYIDFIDDEYFLIDAFHPGFRVALIIAG
jgi:hypothetical protein